MLSGWYLPRAWLLCAYSKAAVYLSGVSAVPTKGGFRCRVPVFVVFRSLTDSHLAYDKPLVALLIQVNLCYLALPAVTSFAQLELGVDHKYLKCAIACVGWTSGYTPFSIRTQLHIR